MFLFVTELWWIRTFFFVSKYVRRHKVQILCEVFTFSPAFKFFTKVWNFKEKRKKKKACSTSDSLTTSLLDHFFFFACVFIPQTATRTYRSWTRVCWHSLIIYVLTCPNADITRPHVLRLFASSHSLLLLLDRDLLFVQTRPQKNPRLVCMKKFFTEHVGPLFITTRDHFITSSTVTSGEEGTGFLFLFFCFFFIRLNPIFILRDFH